MWIMESRNLAYPLTMKSLLAGCLLLSGLQITAFSQSRCTTYYSVTEVPPAYPGGDEGIMKYGIRKIIPLISAYYKKVHEYPITSFRGATLYINRQGIVTNVVITDDRIPASLRNVLCNEFMKMRGWKPARQHGQAVCATYLYTITCMTWQDDD